MNATTNDLRFDAVRWRAVGRRSLARRVRLLVLANMVVAAWYFGWLLQGARIGNPLLFGLLVVAETFNLVQGLGFWWTVRRDRRSVEAPEWEGPLPDVDVLIPVYNEPLDIVEPTVAAATRLPGARVHVAVLDDGNRAELHDLAARHGAAYVRRGVNTGAKAGNLNNALTRTSSPFVLVLDCDHIPGPRLLKATLGHFMDPEVAFVQTPQYYANAPASPIARAAWSQQALFFGAIARGKDRMGSMFCCGTNVVFRRDALEDAGGFPERSLTEDFELSVILHEHGWRSLYVPEVLVRGLGPEDMASYVSQQHRWARGCLSALPRVLRSALPRRLQLQYVLSAMYFLTGWTVLIYMALPVIRIFTGAQPLAGASADQFLVHFAPYFGVSLLLVATAGAGTYSFAAFCLATSAFWVHVYASLSALLRRKGRFVVTPKRGADHRQPRAVWPALVAIVILVTAATFGLWESRSPATLNNVSFAFLHVLVLTAGVAPALRRPVPAVAAREQRRREQVAA